MQPSHIRPALDRLRAITPAELNFRALTLARRQVQRIAVATGGAAWQRASIADIMIAGVLGPDADRAIRQCDWRLVEQRLHRLVRERPCRFIVDPRTARPLRDEIVSRWPDAPTHAAAAADALCQGSFDLLGWQRLSFDSGAGQIDWHWDPVHARRMPLRFWADVPFLDPAHGDHKIVWELNRHQFMLRLGRAWWLTRDRRYADAIVTYFQSWLASNPPLLGINWASMLELALRSISWIAAMHLLLADPGGDPDGTRGDDDSPGDSVWLLDMYVALDRQLTHIEQNLSYYYSPNTHLTGEALALYVAGIALPEFTRSGHWLDVGRRVLLAEVDRQIGADGGHAERSTHYHRYTLDFYLLALLMAERAGDVEAVTVFSDAVARLERFMRAMADDTGRIPLIGDDDGGMLWPLTGRDPRDVRDSLALAACVLNRTPLGDVSEEVFWLGWNSRSANLSGHSSAAVSPTTKRPVEARAFATTGYITVHSRSGHHLVFDAGPHGYLNGGHAHADSLSLTLSIGGQPFLIDPGTGTYTMDAALRDRMRSAASHNTLTLDGIESASPAGPFKWRTRADAHLRAFRRNDVFAWMEAFHDAFASARHRRSVVYSAFGELLVLDEVVTRGDHSATTHWQFDPAWKIGCDGAGRLVATLAEQAVWMLTDHGELALQCGADGGWWSPVYGRLIPTCNAHVTHRAAGPFAMITWIGSEASGSLRSSAGGPTLERLQPSTDGRSPVVAVRVHQTRGVTTTVLRPGEAALEDRHSETAHYHTDATLLQYTFDRDGGAAIVIADGTVALGRDEGLLGVRAETPIEDLSVVYGDGAVELHASAPPSCLHVWGDPLRRTVAVRLNGREWRGTHRPDGMMTVFGVDWHTTPPSRLPRRRATDTAGIDIAVRIGEVA